MKKINAEIITDSVDPRGNRITSFLLTYPRFIHGEIMTHRMFSRNSASSRAIPFDKMVKMVEEDPFIPIAWQKTHKGMQGNKYLNTEESEVVKDEWLLARKQAIRFARVLNEEEFVTKQICNRLLEPFMWHTVLVTATEFGNFFKLRCPMYVVNNYTTTQNKTKVFYSRKDVIDFVKENGIKHGWESCEKWDEVQWQSINNSQAEIHIQALAESMWDAMNESVPVELQEGEWHIPFSDKIDTNILSEMETDCKLNTHNDPEDVIIGIATARCARLSYMTFDGDINYEKDIKLHDHLLKSKHMSPFEHCAKVMNKEEYNRFTNGYNFSALYSEKEDNLIDGFGNNAKGWCNNFRGFVSYRYFIENY